MTSHIYEPLSDAEVADLANVSASLLGPADIARLFATIRGRRQELDVACALLGRSGDHVDALRRALETVDAQVDLAFAYADRAEPRDRLGLLEDSLRDIQRSVRKALENMSRG